MVSSSQSKFGAGNSSTADISPKQLSHNPHQATVRKPEQMKRELKKTDIATKLLITKLLIWLEKNLIHKHAKKGFPFFVLVRVYGNG